MPKKAKKTPKIAILSDSDDDQDDFKRPKKKGHKFALSDSDDEDGFASPKPSASKGKVSRFESVELLSLPFRFHEYLRTWLIDVIVISRIFFDR